VKKTFGSLPRYGQLRIARCHAKTGDRRAGSGALKFRPCKSRVHEPPPPPPTPASPAATASGCQFVSLCSCGAFEKRARGAQSSRRRLDQPAHSTPACMARAGAHVAGRSYSRPSLHDVAARWLAPPQQCNETAPPVTLPARAGGRRRRPHTGRRRRAASYHHCFRFTRAKWRRIKENEGPAANHEYGRSPTWSGKPERDKVPARRLQPNNLRRWRRSGASGAPIGQRQLAASRCSIRFEACAKVGLASVFMQAVSVWPGPTGPVARVQHARL
jgi:hypothetical protein